MPKTGKGFENLTAEIFEALKNNPQYETVEKDVKVAGADCDRQIDVLLRGKVGPFDNITIIECKDYNKPVNITTVDALDSVRRDINADKAVLVSRKGFTKKAIHKAKRLGIRLCTAHSAANEKWKFDLEIPFSITEFSVEAIQPNFLSRTPIDNIKELVFSSVCDIPINQIVAESWNQGKLEYVEGCKEYSLVTDIENAWIRKKNGKQVNVLLRDITVTIKRNYYFGLFNNLESAKLLKYIEDDTGSVVFDLAELANYREKAIRHDERSNTSYTNDTHEFTTKVIINPVTKLSFRPSMRRLIEVAKQANTI
jgi:hypothetical protein